MLMTIVKISVSLGEKMVDDNDEILEHHLKVIEDNMEYYIQDMKDVLENMGYKVKIED